MSEGKVGDKLWTMESDGVISFAGATSHRHKEILTELEMFTVGANSFSKV